MVLAFQKLRARIVEKYGTLTNFADNYHISMTSLSNKMSGKVPFSYKDIIKMSEMLDIENDDIGTYFFTKWV